MQSGKNYSTAIFFILVGVLLLLNTTGIVGWGIWEYIFRFWPVLIVLIGIKIILGNSVVAKTLEILITILLVITVFLISYIQFSSKGVDFLPKQFNDWVLQGGSGIFNLTQETLEEQIVVGYEEYEGIIDRDISIFVGAGELIVKEDTIDDYLIVDSVYPKAFRDPELEKNVIDGNLIMTFTGATSRSFHLFANESKYDLTVGQVRIPTNFDINLDAGKGEMELESLLVKDFFGKVGAGSLSITLGKDSIPSGDIRFNIGAGKLTLNIPDRIGYELDYDLGVGKINADGKDISDFSSGRGKYTSSNYKTSDIKINIIVSVGVGTFKIESN